MALATQVDTNVLASIFEQGSVDIDRYGWKRGGASWPEDMPPNGLYRRCIWIAAMRAAERAIPDVAKLKLYAAAIENVFVAHFETSLVSVFGLNDAHKDVLEGHAWSVDHLQQISKKLRGADAMALVAGTDTD